MSAQMSDGAQAGNGGPEGAEGGKSAARASASAHSGSTSSGGKGGAKVGKKPTRVHTSPNYDAALGFDPTIAGAEPGAPWGYIADGSRPRKRPPFGSPFAKGHDTRRNAGGEPKAPAAPKLRERARSYGEKALKTIVQIMNHGANDRVRLDAASQLLDRGYGKSTQMIAGDGDSPIRFEVREQLVSKLTALAAAVGIPVPGTQAGEPEDEDDPPVH